MAFWDGSDPTVARATTVSGTRPGQPGPKLVRSQDGRRVAVGGTGEITIRDPAQPRAEPLCVPTDDLVTTAIALSADGSTLLAALSNGTVRVWAIGAPSRPPRVLDLGRAAPRGSSGEDCPASSRARRPPRSARTERSPPRATRADSSSGTRGVASSWVLRCRPAQRRGTSTYASRAASSMRGTWGTKRHVGHCRTGPAQTDLTHGAASIGRHAAGEASATGRTRDGAVLLFVDGPSDSPRAATVGGHAEAPRGHPRARRQPEWSHVRGKDEQRRDHPALGGRLANAPRRRRRARSRAFSPFQPIRGCSSWRMRRGSPGLSFPQAACSLALGAVRSGLREPFLPDPVIAQPGRPAPRRRLLRRTSRLVARLTTARSSIAASCRATRPTRDRERFRPVARVRSRRAPAGGRTTGWGYSAPRRLTPDASSREPAGASPRGGSPRLPTRRARPPRIGE